MNRAAALKAKPTSLFLILPVPLRRSGEELLFETQACNGVTRWSEHFDRVVVACPLIPEHLAEQDSTIQWENVNGIKDVGRMEFIPLPWSYHPFDFFRHYRSTRRLLAKRIRECQYLSFAISGLIGDWAAVACREATMAGRLYSVWTDNVATEYSKSGNSQRPFHRRLWNQLQIAVMDKYHKQIIRDSHLGLFHGRDCYDAYAPFCSNSHCVHDIHLKESDQISVDQLAKKIGRAKSSADLRICYVGRAIDIKGPLDWLAVISDLKRAGLPVSATWVGDGESLESMRDRATQLGIDEIVCLPGHCTNRQQLLETMQKHDLFVFCHKIAESPRCLIESLICGTPIVGYYSRYAEDLLSERGGGLLSPINEPHTLAAKIQELFVDRSRLSKLVDEAAWCGQQFSDVAVFKHRSELIKQYTGNIVTN